MLARRDWITPVLYSKVWLEKPVLYYWEAILSYSVFGVSDWAARLPSAFSASLMVVAVYLVFRRLRSGAELDAALITASCAAIVGFAHGASTDMPLAAALAISLLAWFAWFETGTNAWLVAFYFFLALATLAKGPVAVLLTALIVLGFCVIKRDFLIAARTLWIPGILLFCVVALPWYVAVQVRNPEFFRVFLLEHNLARFATGVFHHQQPFWYYLPVLALGLLPWSVLAFAALVGSIESLFRRTTRPSANDFEHFLLLWAVIPVIFFSLSQSKLPGYVLPAIPAFALLVGSYLHNVVPPEVRQATARYSWHSMVWIICHAAVAAGMLIPLLLSQYILLHRPLTKTAAVFSASIGAVIFIAILATVVTRGVRTLRFVTLVPVVLGVAFLLRIGGPAINNTLSARPVAKELQQIEVKHLPVAIFHSTRETEYGLAFYLNQTISNYDRGEVPSGEHLVVAAAVSQAELMGVVGSRRVAHLGSFAPQRLEYYWVAAAAGVQ